MLLCCGSGEWGRGCCARTWQTGANTVPNISNTRYLTVPTNTHQHPAAGTHLIG